LTALQPLLHSKKDAAFLLSVSVRTIDNLLVCKQLRPVRIGSRVMIAATELERFIRRDHPTGAELN
jgi:excisionase family DNA binding protein